MFREEEFTIEFIDELKKDCLTNEERQKGIKRILNHLTLKVYAKGKINTKIIIDKIVKFNELYSGIEFYPYQEQFSRRVIRSVLENDGAELTALFSRQSGKSETISTTVGGLMIILPKLANMPMFANDKRFEMYKDGLWVGVFAPGQRQAKITFNRMKTRLQCKRAITVLEDPDFRLEFSTSNGQTVALTNGSHTTAISASDTSNIEGETFKFIIIEEAQDVSDFKVKKCLPADTQILSENGYVSIEEVVKKKDNKTKIAYFKDMTDLEYSVPEDYYNTGILNCFEVELHGQRKITATSEHKFYTRTRRHRSPTWRTVNEINNLLSKDINVQMGVPSETNDFGDKGSYNEGLLLGYLLGDGNYSGSKPAFIGDKETIERLERITPKEVNVNVYNKLEKSSMYEVGLTTEGNKMNSNPITVWLKELGIWEDTGVNKKIPNKRFSKEFYKGLVESLIETDGCIENSSKKPIVSFASISRNMIEQLRRILVKFGIHSSIYSKENGEINGYGSKELHLLHVKSVSDIKKFHEEFRLFTKQDKLENAVKTLSTKNGRNRSKHYPSSMRFYQVKEIRPVGEKQTYCLKMPDRNFIAEDIISSNSIHPMGSAYNATITKIGTPTTHKGDFYEAIQRNKRDYANNHIAYKNHFEYDWRVGAKYNDKYRKFVNKEKRRLGEESDEFRMSYELEWVLERGMFIDISRFEKRNGLEKAQRKKKSDMPCVAGIDLAKSSDSTVVTVVGVDWSKPVVTEGEDIRGDTFYSAYESLIKDWREINSSNYNLQFDEIIEYLSDFNIQRIVIDSTAEGSFADRLEANVDVEVIPYKFTRKSKSELYKHAEGEIQSGRAKYPASEEVQETREYRLFLQQLADLRKEYKGQYLSVSHPDKRGAKDDYPDSWALALWGAKSKNNTVEVEVEDNNPFFQNEKKTNQVYHSRNNLTARRR